ncbi:hypothetical protein HanIR_Chr14g0700621 [Helianthus annuus]|nr:hypothetical protein HanIR_Chr14g0700621 [Helianthus annuus]
METKIMLEPTYVKLWTDWAQVLHQTNLARNESCYTEILTTCDHNADAFYICI